MFIGIYPEGKRTLIAAKNIESIRRTDPDDPGSRCIVRMLSGAEYEAVTKDGKSLTEANIIAACMRATMETIHM